MKDAPILRYQWPARTPRGGQCSTSIKPGSCYASLPRSPPPLPSPPSPIVFAMFNVLRPNRTWNGDEGHGFSRRQANAHKLSSINYPGLGDTHPNTPITSPPAFPSPTYSSQAAPGPSRAQHPDQSARMPPRAVSAPAVFSPQVVGAQALPTSPQPPIATLPTHVVQAAPRHYPHAPQGLVSSSLHPELHKMGKWCWVEVSNAGWAWAWVPNIPPAVIPVVAPPGAWFELNQMRPLDANGPSNIRPASHLDGKSQFVRAKGVQTPGSPPRWFWVVAWVPNWPPSLPPPSHTAEDWARQGPPPL